MFSTLYQDKMFNMSLKIPKGQSESVNRRTTDNTKEKKQDDQQRSTKHNTEIYRLSNTNHTKNRRDELRCSGRVSSSCSISHILNQFRARLSMSSISRVAHCADIFLEGKGKCEVDTSKGINANTI